VGARAFKEVSCGKSDLSSGYELGELQLYLNSYLNSKGVMLEKRKMLGVFLQKETIQGGRLLMNGVKGKGRR